MGPAEVPAAVLPARLRCPGDDTWGNYGCGRSGRHRVPDHSARMATAARLRPRSGRQEDPLWPGDGWVADPAHTGPSTRVHGAARRPPPPACTGSRTSEIGNEGGDGGVDDVQGRWRQMGVARGGTGALVAQQFLNDPQ